MHVDDPFVHSSMAVCSWRDQRCNATHEQDALVRLLGCNSSGIDICLGSAEGGRTGSPGDIGSVNSMINKFHSPLSISKLQKLFDFGLSPVAMGVERYGPCLLRPILQNRVQTVDLQRLKALKQQLAHL